jgi:hypothetical protein
MAGTGAEDDERFDPSRIIDVLDGHQVDYLLIGGLAANAYGARRPTLDLDCIPRRTDDNLTRLATALRQLDARPRINDDPDADVRIPLDAATLRNWQQSTWRTNAGDLDILTDIPDANGRRQSYDDLASDASTATVHGHVVLLASLPAIIASKQYANRPKDRDALPELEALANDLDDPHREPWPGQAP